LNEPDYSYFNYLFKIKLTAPQGKFLTDQVLRGK
jgi:hypothetical protein